MIYVHDLADVRLSQHEGAFLSLCMEAAQFGYVLPAPVVRKQEALMADIERVARWKFEH